MTIEQYYEQRATVLNALYCSVKSAIQTEDLHNNHRIEWIENDFEVCRKKLEAIFIYSLYSISSKECHKGIGLCRLL
jgi:hypothetical protein